MNFFLSLGKAIGHSQALVRGLRQTFCIFLASGILLFTTACGSTTPSSMASSPTSKAAGETNLYDTVQPKVGGMNNFNDDPRYDSPGAVIQSRAHSDTARVDKAVGRMSDKAENALDKAQNKGEDVLKGGKRQAADALDSAQDVARDLKKSIQRTGEDIKDAL